MIWYPSAEQVPVINVMLVGVQSQLRDPALLLSALARPALLHSLSHNHPFVDGNKRTATVTTILFLEQNGWVPDWKPEAALDFVLEVAQNQRTLSEIADWFRENTAPKA